MVDFDASKDSLNNQRLVVGAMIVERIRSAILEKTDFHCSAGIAHNKVCMIRLFLYFATTLSFSSSSEDITYNWLDLYLTSVIGVSELDLNPN